MRRHRPRRRRLAARRWRRRWRAAAARPRRRRAPARRPGMPHTTLVGSSWPMVMAPASRMVRSPTAPSRPMPVSSTPTAVRAAGRGGAGERRVHPGHVELPVRRGRAARPADPGRARCSGRPGRRARRPAAAGGRAWAITTGSGDSPSSQVARPSTKPSAMCCTTSTGTGQVGRQVGEDRGQRGRAAGRGADDDDADVARCSSRPTASGDAPAARARRWAPCARSSPLARSRLRGWVMTRTRLATRRWRRRAVDVLRRARQRVERADHVDRAGGQGGLRVRRPWPRRRRPGSAGCP